MEQLFIAKFMSLYASFHKSNTRVQLPLKIELYHFAMETRVIRIIMSIIMIIRVHTRSNQQLVSKHKSILFTTCTR